jgi:hypothetical protein
MAGGVDVSNDRQHVGRKLRRLRLTGRAHALDGIRFPRAFAAA